jgi:hypothetical protein
MAAKKASRGGAGSAAKAGRGKADENRRPVGISVAAHPRAGVQVRRAKGFFGLVGFAIAAWVSLNAGVPADQAGLRAVACGIAGYLIAWAFSVAIWRQLVLAELRAHQEKLEAAAEPDDSGMIQVGDSTGEVKPVGEPRAAESESSAAASGTRAGPASAAAAPAASGG